MSNKYTTDHLGPMQGGFAITAGEDPLTHATRGIVVAVAGNVTATLTSGDSVEVYLIAGVIHELAATHVTAATATGIVGLY